MLNHVACIFRKNLWVAVFLAGVLLILFSAPIGYSIGNQFTMQIGAMVTESYVAFLNHCIQAIQLTGTLTSVLGIAWFYKHK